MILSVVLLCPVNLSAANTEKLVVRDLIGKALEQAKADIFTRLVINELESTGKFRIYSKTEIQEVLNQIGLVQQLGKECDTTKCIIDFGAAMGADRVLAGEVGKIGSRYVVTLSLYNIPKGEREERRTWECACSEDELTDNVKRYSLELLGLEKPEQQESARQTPTPAKGNTTISKENIFRPEILRASLHWNSRVAAYNASLHWNSISGVAAYNIHRSRKSSSDYILIGTVSGNELSYVDSTIEYGNTYYYVLSTINDRFEESMFSAARYVTVSNNFNQSTVNSDAEVDARSIYQIIPYLKDSLYKGGKHYYGPNPCRLCHDSNIDNKNRHIKYIVDIIEKRKSSTVGNNAVVALCIACHDGQIASGIINVHSEKWVQTVLNSGLYKDLPYWSANQGTSPNINQIPCSLCHDVHKATSEMPHLLQNKALLDLHGNK